jgi:hypothetical protein
MDTAASHAAGAVTRTSTGMRIRPDAANGVVVVLDARTESAAHGEEQRTPVTA